MLYEALPDNVMRAFDGTIVGDFNEDDVCACIDGERVDTSEAPTLIVTACIPSGGGSSRTSLASGYFDDAGNLVVGGGCVCHLCRVQHVSRHGRRNELCRRPHQHLIGHLPDVLNERVKLLMRQCDVISPYASGAIR